jgi:hypothetical protein
LFLPNAKAPERFSNFFTANIRNNSHVLLRALVQKRFTGALTMPCKGSMIEPNIATI